MNKTAQQDTCDGEEREVRGVLDPRIEKEDTIKHLTILSSNVRSKETTHTMPKQIDPAPRMTRADFSKDKLDIFHIGMIVVDMPCQTT